MTLATRRREEEPVMEMNPDLCKLKQAVSEISEILKKYDCGGHITLASKDHGEYLVHLPTWSKLQVEENGIRVKHKGKDTDGLLASTVHMMQVFELQGRQISTVMEQVLEKLESQTFITGGPKRL